MLLTVALVFLLAGLVKGVVGLGLPTLAMGLLTLSVAPAEAATLLLVPSLVTNLWQMLVGPGLRPLLRRLWPMLAGVVAGTLAGGGLAAGSGAKLGLGLALLAYAAVALAAPRWRVPARAEPVAGPLVGLATGLVTSATGVFVVPAVPYLQALGLPRDALVQALGLSFTVSTIALAGGLALQAPVSMELATTSLLALLPALVGMALGQWLRTKLSPETFRRCFLASLGLLGAWLVVA